MKLSCLYNLIEQYLFFCLFVTLSNSQYFNYTESKLGDLNAPPLIADIKTYNDRTILIHIIRNESTQTDECSKIRGMSLEQKLHIRLIFLNGTVKEIDPNLKLVLEPINYCLLNSDGTDYKINKFNNKVVYLNDTKNKNNNLSILHNLVNPITIYPLQKLFILVTYVITTNSSDPTTYEECMEVIDWNGISRSNMCFDGDYDGVWINSTIQLNVNKKLGFIRFAYKLSRAWVCNDYGNWTKLTGGALSPIISKQTHDDYSLDYSLITTAPTIDSGYLVIFNNTKRINNITVLGFIANFITYNDPRTHDYEQISIDILQTTKPNMIITSVYCDISASSLGSPASFDSKNITIRWLYIGVTAYDNNDNNTYYYIYPVGLPDKMSLGPFLTNYFGVNAITQNNTFLLASPYTNDNISWSLLTIPLSGYYNDYDNIWISNTIPSINANVDSSTTFLNITFQNTIYLLLSTNNITIYKASDNNIRQRVSATLYDFCKISPDQHTVSIKVIGSTFNEYDEQYFVTMDNNFVKTTTNINGPLEGIQDGIWTLKTDNAIAGIVRLTQDASKKFSTFSKDNQSAYIDNLLNELAVKVPINRYCLRSDNRFHNEFYDQDVIFICIDIRNNEIKRIASEVSSDLNNMIIYKNITTFSYGITNDLDQDFGFKPMWNVWNDLKVQLAIILGVIIFIIFCLLFPIICHKLKSKKFDAISSAILRLALIIPNFILSILFTVYDSKNVPNLYLPSMLVLCIPLNINFYITVYTIYKGIKNPFIGTNFKEWIVKYRASVIILIILAATDFEYLTILKDIPIFAKKLDHYEQINIFNILEHIFDVAILWGAVFDIFF
ncbi:hypothetical protein F8M41_008540 [Gigaspora margarita]|uniref:Uncharacterized protein n=1 Tax=Gigaspora margarita TaxID=4874 RepID=A0A8H4B4I6_GIGMA|nr:hypothetical protein F8M41_008540 [Gigaspora margarita]